MHCDLLESKGYINSRGVFVWSLMMLVLKGKAIMHEIFFKNQCIVTDLWSFEPEINTTHPQLNGSLCVRFHDNRG